ncbi:MAG: hypothetical protein MJZ41_16495 [Bacteroidaceae bacterium]|nr:hypothetical protein [Bacteroidaceae bacterium]
MGYVSDWLSGACNCCTHARQKRNGDWWCTCHEDDYFPDAAWDEDDSECPSYDADEDAIDDSEDWEY